MTTSNANESSSSSDDSGDSQSLPDRPICDICCLPLPILNEESFYNVCCGVRICCGCVHQHHKAEQARHRFPPSCAFCRQPSPQTNTKVLSLLKKRIKKYNDPNAMFMLSGSYRDGDHFGIAKNPAKEVELLYQAANLGHGISEHVLGIYYLNGYSDGNIEKNWSKAKQYLESSAHRGTHVPSWNVLGMEYIQRGDFKSGLYHLKVAASYGYDRSCDALRYCYKKGDVSKEDLLATLRAWKVAKDEMESEERKESREWGAKELYGLQKENKERMDDKDH